MRIKDIARMAGVSTAMVSRVINNSGYVSREKREKIEKIIEQTGFQLNAQARSLRTRHSSLIASVVPSLDSTYIVELQEKLLSALEQDGYHLLITTWRRSGKDENLYRILASLSSAGVEAIVLFHDGLSEEEKEFLENYSVPVLLVDEQAEGLCCMENAQKEAGFAMMQLAAENGFRRVAYLDAPTLKEARGMEDALQEHPEVEGIPVPIDLSDSHTAQIPDLAAAVMAIDPPVEAFLSFSDRIAAGVRSTCRLSGRNLCTAGMGNTPLAQLNSDPMTTVDLHADALVEQIVDSVRDCQTEAGPRKEIWKNTFTIIHPELLRPQ